MNEKDRLEIEGAVSNSGITWEVEPSGTAVISIDTPGSAVNLLSLQALIALEEAAEFLARREGVRGVLIRSMKPDHFIAGADVTQFAEVKSEKDALGKSMAGQRVFSMLEALPFPTLAAISGVCLGGGLELALACTARVASDSEKVQLALPEVKLGIIPGWGGTQRLPQLLPLPAALDMILTGRGLRARQALKAGLVDRLVPPERLVTESRRILDQLAGLSRADARGRLRRTGRLDSALRAFPLRNLVLSRAAAAVRKKTGGHYPAPLAAIDAVRAGLATGGTGGFLREANKVASLVTGDVSRNLVQIFLSSRDAGAGDGDGKITRAGVLGAGVMGGGIAAVMAGKGVQVRMRDVAVEPLERGMQHAARILSRRGRRRLPEAESQARLARLSPSLTLDGFRPMELVVEAVVENLDLKKRVLGELESRVNPRCILASNTSSLSIDAIASGLRDPSRLVGLHFFNPAEKMPLVEVIRGARSDPEAVSRSAAFVRALGKTPVVVGDAPGFVVNRLLMPYLSEALQVVSGGGEPREIDDTLTRFGMPMGPLELLDQIGLDVAAKVAGVLSSAFGERLPSPGGLEAMAQAGFLGTKSGKGFYTGSGRSRQVNTAALALVRKKTGTGGAGPAGDLLVRRLLYPVVNEAAMVLEEKVAGSAAEVDLAMVFGTGFPPFLGGPLRWADRIGISGVVRSLDEMAAAGGAHLAPSEALRSLSSETRRFHSS